MNERTEEVGHMTLRVSWGSENNVERATPSAQELAGLFLGLEESYEVLGSVFGYPPHFLKITSVSNPELTINVEGGKDVIEAIRALIFAVPSLIANLFRPRAAIKLAEAENARKVAEENAAAAMANARAAEAKALIAEANVREVEARTREAESKARQAELEAARARQEMLMMPIQADPEAHAMLRELATALAAAEASKRVPFVGDTMRYVVSTRRYVPSGRVVLAVVQPP